MYFVSRCVLGIWSVSNGLNCHQQIRRLFCIKYTGRALWRNERNVLMENCKGNGLENEIIMNATTLITTIPYYAIIIYCMYLIYTCCSRSITSSVTLIISRRQYKFYSQANLYLRKKNQSNWYFPDRNDFRVLSKAMIG